MRNFFKKIITFGKIDLGNSNRDQDKFYKEIRGLINILFAVVFATSLSALKEFDWGYDFLILVLAYFAILLSWWGYHFGTFIGGRENNIVNILIDCGLLAIYYLLITQRHPFILVIGRYSLMFGLYFLWELVRVLEGKGKAVNVAAIVNLSFFLIIGFLYILCSKYECFNVKQCKLWFIIFLYVVLFGYRVVIHKVYTKYNNLN